MHAHADLSAARQVCRPLEHLGTLVCIANLAKWRSFSEYLVKILRPLPLSLHTQRVRASSAYRGCSERIVEKGILPHRDSQ